MKRVEIIPEDINLEPDTQIQIYSTTYGENGNKDTEDDEEPEGQQED